MWGCGRVAAWKSCSVEDIWRGGVVAWESRSVCEAVAVCGNCSLWELQCMGVAVYGSCSVGELWCGGVVVCGSRIVIKFHCGGTAMCGGHGGYQIKPNTLRLRCFSRLPRFQKKNIHFLKNSLWLNRSPQLISQ